MEVSQNYRRVMVVTCMAAALVPFMGSALNLAVPSISGEFRMDALMSIWIMAAYMLSCAIFQIPFARLADIFGRVKIFRLGIFLSLVAAILNACAFSGESLIAFRFLSGIGSALVFGTNVAILTSAVPQQKRGWALGINSGGVYFGLSLGPVFGGFLVEALGWRAIFIAAAVWSALVLAGSFVFIRSDSKNGESRAFDYVGSLLSMLGLSFTIYGFSRFPELLGFSFLCAGIFVMTLFVRYEHKCKAPVFNVDLFFKNRVFGFSMLAVLVNYAATISIGYMLGLYLQHIRGLSPSRAALVIVMQAFIMAAVSINSGRLSDKYSPFKMASAGMAITALGLFALISVDEHTGYAAICVMLSFVGFGFGLFASPNMNIIMSSVDRKDYAFAGAATGTVRLVGQAFSMGIAFVATAFFVGDKIITPEVHTQFMHAMRATFLAGALLCTLGIFASLVRNGAGSARKP